MNNYSIFLDKNFIFYPSWGNPDGRGNPDGWGNPDGFSGKNRKINFSNKLNFFQNLTTRTLCLGLEIVWYDTWS